MKMAFKTNESCTNLMIFKGTAGTFLGLAVQRLSVSGTALALEKREKYEKER